MVRLNLVYYGQHTPETDALILRIKPQYIIANPPHGLWGEIYGYDTASLLQGVAACQSAGIKVIGYITGGYEGKGSGSSMVPYYYSLKLNLRMIKNMAEIDHVNGVFIDECSAFPNPTAREYLRELTTLARSYGLITWGNVGRDEFDPWFFTGGGFDLMTSTEQWQSQQLSRVQSEWGYRISVTGFKATYTAQDAVELTLDAWKKGIAYCYISNDEYASLPVWLEEYASLLRKQTG
jgi:hypothetical protein